MLRTVTRRRPPSRPPSTRHGSTHTPDARASAQLRADAVREDTEAATAQPHPHLPAELSRRAHTHPDWTGDEPLADAVLRMLVDKYKPLRGGAVRTAEERLRSAPPADYRGVQAAGATTAASPPEDPSSASAASTAHKSWLTTFHAPSHTISVRYMRLQPVPPSQAPNPSNGPAGRHRPDDARARIMEREQRRKEAHAGRLTGALDASLDYRIGKTTAPSPASGGPRVMMHHPNPVGLKGWANLVEERIERARRDGHFRSLKGRGKPIVRESEQGNPFISREEFLMNRIVQRQGAAPPWVEYQRELETAIDSFRGVLRSSWTRRAVRALVSEHPPGALLKLEPGDVTGQRMRDREWEAREKSYHEQALREINALVRKYNGVAPYAVRRTYLTRESELERMYETSGEDILDELQRRGKNGNLSDEGVADSSSGQELEAIGFGWRVMWKEFLAFSRSIN